MSDPESSSIETNELQKKVLAPRNLPAAEFEARYGFSSRALEGVLLTLDDREKVFVELQVAVS